MAANITSPKAQELIAKSEEKLAQALYDQAHAIVTELRKDVPPDEPPPEGAEDDAPPMGDEPPAMDGPPPEAGPEGEPEITREEAVQMLQAMSPDQLAMWADALAEVQGGPGGHAEPDGDEPPPPAEETPPADAMKSELAKMEQRITASFQKQIQALAKSAPGAKPQRRAATGPERPAAPPAPRLSKSEISAKLNELARRPNKSAQYPQGLTKSDRSLINGVVCGDLKIDAISHLLKDAK